MHFVRHQTSGIVQLTSIQLTSAQERILLHETGVALIQPTPAHSRILPNHTGDDIDPTHTGIGTHSAV